MTQKRRGYPRKTPEQAIVDFAAKHGGKYDYSQTVYVTAHHRVTIICPRHGPFGMIANSHLNGQGCPQCAREKVHYWTHAKVVERARERYGDHLKTIPPQEIKNGDSFILYVCERHGRQRAKLSSFMGRKLTSGGCKKCSFAHIRAPSRRLTKDAFILRATSIHGTAYDYSKVEYRHGDIPVEIICRRHGAFFQPPGRHTAGHGCPACGRERSSLAGAARLRDLSRVRSEISHTDQKSV